MSIRVSNDEFAGAVQDDGLEYVLQHYCRPGELTDKELGALVRASQKAHKAVERYLTKKKLIEV